MSALKCIALALVAGVIFVTGACSGSDDCDSSECATGNKCLAFNGETKCRKTCSSNFNPATSCPFGYTCTDPETGVEPFCLQDRAVGADGKPLTKQTSGQWGSKCAANLGSQNPECDGAQDFYCYGISPTDADAYCTRYGCTADEECGAGFWCAQINKTPNILSQRRTSVGQTQSVCLKRAHCATCKVDLDCPDIAGKRQHCVADGNGDRVCLGECDSNQACPNEAYCAAVGGFDSKLCYPRAQKCVGDGSLCSPCRVDTDCGTDGICLKGAYTTERSCAKATSACSECPKTVSTGAERRIGCSSTGSDELPANFCVGLYAIGGTPSDLGCWTPNR